MHQNPVNTPSTSYYSSTTLTVFRQLLATLTILITTSFYAFASTSEDETRQLLVDLVTGEAAQQEATLEALSEKGEKIIETVVEAWRAGKISTVPQADGQTPIVLLKTDDDSYKNLLDDSAYTPDSEPKINRPSRALRKTLRRMVTILQLNAPDLEDRIGAAERLGMSQNPEYLEDLKAKLPNQTDSRTKDAFQTAISISELANGTEEEKLAAVKTLGKLKSFNSRDFLTALQTEYKEKEGSEEMLTAIKATIARIDSHQTLVDWAGTLLRGLSLGSVLLLVSYGLAITFGQMGVINMAHGEFIAIGGYTTYFIQNLFASQFGASSSAFGWYFIVALPCAFLVAAIAGAILEKGLIQFLYTRPLESLLATWGVSMVLQQLFRIYFGSANVSVSSPEWLSGSYHLAGVSMSYNRLLLIACAIILIFVTWLLMNKTNWGLHVRATMQNRQMASNLGVPSGRVNMLTFAFGSGLAGLAGAFISQIGNVGPLMGSTYIVDSFMVVVAGGVGNLFGTAISALGIGVIDQSLQPIFGPVMGKISVLFGIIIFLQFKPGGLFPSRSRSLDD
ncbi:MAG: urea ABC transporter permease subunit UrtB [Akkermansiaceae bacterium]